MDEIDKMILRAWSAVVSRGMIGSAREVAAYLGLTVQDVASRLATLRAVGQLPRETLFPAPVAS